MATRLHVVGIALVVLALSVSARGDFLYTDDFTAPDGTPVETYGGYTRTGGGSPNVTAEILGGRLRLHSSTTTGQNGVTSDALMTWGAGSFVKANVWYSWPTGGGIDNGFVKLGGNIAFRASGNRVGFWDSSWNTGGSDQVSANNPDGRHIAVLYVGGSGDGRTAHVFVDKQYNVSFTDDLDNTGQQVGATGNAAHMRIQTGKNNSSVYAEYDNLAAFQLTNNGAGAAAAYKAERPLAFSETFGGGAVGTWTLSESTPGRFAVSTGDAVRLSVADASGTPWARYTLDLGDFVDFGGGLGVGDYLQIDLKREQASGYIGVWTDLMNSNVRLSGAASGPLGIWGDRFGTDQGSTWNTISPAGVSFDISDWVTLGMRLDYADGEIAVMSYYIDDEYAGSWLFDTDMTRFTQFALFGQTDQNNSGFLFDNLEIYAQTPEPASLGLLLLGAAGIGRYVRRRRE
ncbi:MAG TPA: PEP-CTERM sorting domain-containing protein [Phycisphaerae bacterium]|nr:PEP-CTERM sorting domain-containing protein [Phycisphaerae bacterium]HQL72735.1 PEP-CTERM sorting domain-containing protein [Phycisphaerae bacterium]